MLDFTKTELQRNNHVKFAEDLQFSNETFAEDSRLNSLTEVNVTGQGYYQADLDIFVVRGKIKGVMLVPCAISLVELKYPFSCELSMTYTFTASNEEGLIYVKKNIVDLKPEIFRCIMQEVPFKVVADNINYKKEENWEVVSEKDYYAEVKEQVDTRLLKFKDYKFEDDKEE